MNVELVTIDRERITFTLDNILPLLGIAEEKLDPHTDLLISDYTSRCKSIMDPKGAYARFTAVTPDSEEVVEIIGTRFCTGKIIRNMLRHSEEYALFVVTAGPEPEELSRRLMKEGQYLEGLITDVVASAIVESAANQVEQQIMEMADSMDMKITNRYSPGYCSWHVSEQQKLFSLFPEDCCGINLSQSSLMSPIKSISGIIGMGKSVIYKDYTCEICPMKECVFRKAIQNQSGLTSDH